MTEAAQPREEAFRLGLELVERKLPAIEATAHVLLEDAERRVQRPSDVRVPAAELGDVREVALGEET